jgi:hypothetical protein
MLSRPKRARSVPCFIVGITALGVIAPLFAAEGAADTATQTPDASQAPAPMCLEVANIRRTNAPDSQHLVFYMRDGKVWENTLPRTCAGLTSNSWTWVVRGPLRVCANTHRLRIFQNNVICAIGDFAPPRPDTKN